jgi:hypothetical protein
MLRQASEISMQANFLTGADRLHKTIRRQAKRLQSRLDIHLHQAKRILAQAAYHCANWEDLETRLTDGSSHFEALHLAQLPRSTTATLYLEKHIQDIARSIGRLVLTNHNLVGMIGVLRFVFEERDEPAHLSDAVRSLQALPWYTTNVATDPLAVVEAYVNINGAPMKLVGTRVYLPQYLNLGDELNPLAHLAANFGTPLEIMWSDPAAWHEAAKAYLSASDDDFDEAELIFPRTEITVSMQEHENWFRRVLAAWPHISEYRDYDEAEFIPLVTPSGCYLVFGFPTSLDKAWDAPSQIEPLRLCGSDDYDFERTLVLVHSYPLCIQWTAGESDSTPAFQAVFSHPDCDPSVLTHARPDPGVFFIHPASDWDIRYQMQLRVTPNRGQVATVIKTDNIELTDQILKKITRRDLTRYTSEAGHEHFVMELDISDQVEFKGFSLAFDLIGEDREHWSSLISLAMTHTDDTDRRRMILELNDRIFVLHEKLGKDAVLEAARDGIVLHGTQSLDDAIDKVPRWCRQLPATPTWLIDHLDSGFKSIAQAHLTDLWRYARLPKYRRDNY